MRTKKCTCWSTLLRNPLCPRHGDVALGEELARRPCYVLTGNPPTYDLPDVTPLKEVGGRVVFGKFSVWFRDNTSRTRAWIVDRRERDETEIIATFSRYRTAMAEAKMKHKEDLTTRKT